MKRLNPAPTTSRLQDRRLWILAACAVLLSCAARAGTPAAREEMRARPLSFEPNLGQAGSDSQFVAHGPGYALALDRQGAALELGTRTLRLSLDNAQGGRVPRAENPLPGKVNYYLGNDPAQWHENVDTYARVRYTAVYPGIDLVYYGTQGRLEYDFDVAPGANAGAIRVNFAGAGRLSLDARGNLHVAADGQEVVFDRPVAYQHDDRREVAVRYRLHGRSVGFTVGRHDPHQMLVIDPVLDYFSYLGGSGADVIGSTAPQIGQVSGQAAAVDRNGNLYVAGYTTSTNFPTQSAYQSSVSAKPGNTWAFVTKFAADGKSAIFSTYLGGSLGADYAYAIALDPAGNAFVTGQTGSNDFPVTSGAYQTICSPNFHDSQQVAIGGCGGASSAFVSKFSPSGALLASTFLGSTYGSTGTALAVDATGRPYVTGYAPPGLVIPSGIGGEVPAIGFPTTAGAIVAAYVYSSSLAEDAGALDAFVSVFDPGLTTLVYSTLLGDARPFSAIDANGNRANTYGTAVAVDASGNFYLAGYTADEYLPTTAGSLQPLPGDCGPSGSGESEFEGSCGFVAKFSAVAGSTSPSLTYATYLGGTYLSHLSPRPGSWQDYISGIAADPAGNAYVLGYTNSAGYPTTAGAYQTTCDGYDLATTTGNPDCGAATVAKLDPTGSILLASTYFGCVTCSGDAVYTVGAIALDTANNVYISGIGGNGLALVNGYPSDNTLGGAAFVAELNPSLTTLNFSTYINVGNSGQIATAGLALDTAGDIYFAGNVNSPAASAATSGAFQASYGGGSSDGFVAKIGLLPFYAAGKLTIPTLTVGAVTYTNVVVTIASLVSGPSGTAPAGTAVTYTAATDELTLPEVSLGTTVYDNVVVKPAALVAIGAASNADTYDGTTLHIPSVQVVGGAVYTDVSVTVAGLDGIAGGIPAAPRDQYTPANRQLFIPAVEYGGRLYTNVTITVGTVE